MKKILKALVLIFAGVFFIRPYAFAVLNLELTHGVEGGIPIAIVPFESGAASQGSQGLGPSSNESLSDIIKTDLKNSGEFDIFDSQLFPQEPHMPNQVDFTAWQRLHVDNLVIGTFSPNKTLKDQMDVSFSLIDLYKDKNTISHASDPVLLSQTFQQVKPKELRRLGHKIADSIYQKLTGTPGIFSTKIAYVLVKRLGLRNYSYQLMVADFDGQNPHPILMSPEPIMSPVFSPNGQDMAYVSFEKKRAAIYISNIQTGQRRLITRFSGINGAPSFSPDGNALAVVLSRTGSPKIYLLNLRSKKLQQLTFGWSIDTEPSFSPNGREIVFTSNRGGSPQIYCLNLMTNRVTRLTFDGNYNTSASFTPDGKTIVFLHRAQNGNYDIAKLDVNVPDAQMMVLAADGDFQSPSLSKNGKMVLFAQNYGHHGTLGLVSIDGRVKLRLPESDGGQVSEPAFQR